MADPLVAMEWALVFLTVFLDGAGREVWVLKQSPSEVVTRVAGADVDRHGATWEVPVLSCGAMVTVYLAASFGTRAWRLLRLSELWARKAGAAHAHSLRLLHMLCRQGHSLDGARGGPRLCCGEREYSTDETPVFRFRTPSACVLRLIPCIAPATPGLYGGDDDRYFFSHAAAREEIDCYGDDDPRTVRLLPCGARQIHIREVAVARSTASQDLPLQLAAESNLVGPFVDRYPMVTREAEGMVDSAAKEERGHAAVAGHRRRQDFSRPRRDFFADAVQPMVGPACFVGSAIRVVHASCVTFSGTLRRTSGRMSVELLDQLPILIHRGPSGPYLPSVFFFISTFHQAAQLSS